MAIVGLDGRLLAVNAALCRGAGLTEEELLSTRWDDLAHPDELAEHRDRLQALNRDGIGVYTAEQRYLHPDGRTRWLRETASLVRDSSGAPQYLIAQVVDVTASKDTAEALRASEQRYRTLVNNLPQTSVVTYDRDLRLTLAAGPALMESGMESRQVEGHSLAELSAAADFERLEPIFRAAFGGERNSMEYVDESGRGLWLRTLPLRDGSGKVTGAMAVSLDVTDRVRAREAQLSAEARFLRAFQDSGVGMALSGIGHGEEKLLDANDALCELTGYTREELVQRAWRSLNHPDDAPAAEAAVRRLMAARKTPCRPSSAWWTARGARSGCCSDTSLVRDEPARRRIGSFSSRTCPSTSASSASCSIWPTTTR